MMTPDFPDDETILSAYLDGELDFELRQVVESSLASDPQFADRLRRLGEVRELIAGLDRPRPHDLSAEILDRINRRQESWHGRRAMISVFKSPRLWHIEFGITLIAASIAICLLPFLSDFWRGARGVAPGSMAKRSGLQAVREPAAVSEPVKKKVEAASAVSIPTKTREITTPAPTVKTQLAGGSPARRVSEEGNAPRFETEPGNAQARVGRLLDNPDLRHVFLIADQIGRPVMERVSNLIEQTAKADYFAITVAQGIVVDPTHPGRAKVFVFTIDDSELDRFRARLTAALNDQPREIEAAPELVTQLSDIGQVIIYSPPAAGEIVIPRVDVALKAKAQERSTAIGPIHAVNDIPQLPLASDELEGGSPRRTDSLNLAAESRLSDHPGRGGKAESDGRATLKPSDRTNGQTGGGRSLNGRNEALPQHPPDRETSPHQAVILVWISSPSPG